MRDLPGYDDWKLATPPEYEREEPVDDEEEVYPCDVCGVLTLVDFLEDVSEVCGRERAACPVCVEKRLR